LRSTWNQRGWRTSCTHTHARPHSLTLTPTHSLTKPRTLNAESQSVGRGRVSFEEHVEPAKLAENFPLIIAKTIMTQSRPETEHGHGAVCGARARVLRGARGAGKAGGHPARPRLGVHRPARQPLQRRVRQYRGTSLIRNSAPLGPYSRTIPRVIWWS